jgi:sugar-specific transcriptional regulator TrmB
MEMIKKLGEVFGLSTYEAGIYTALVSNGPSHVANIGKYTHTPRTAVYPPLKSLLKKGLISESVFGKRKYYSAIPAENLRSMFEEKRNSLENVLLELGRSTQLSSKEAKLDVTFYPGAQGIKAAGLIFMNETKDKVWHSFENLSRVTDSVGFEFENFYIEERVKRKIRSKVILSMDEESPAVRKILKEDESQLRETIILSPSEYPFETTIAVTKGLILLINPNQNQFALLIRNQFLASTFLNIHRFIWDRFKK